MKDDLISRQDAINALYDWSNHTMTDAEAWHLRQVIGDIKSMSSAEPERTAKVEKVTRVSSVIRTGRCGDCGYDVIDSYKHCPNCGAKLDWGE